MPNPIESYPKNKKTKPKKKRLKIRKINSKKGKRNQTSLEEPLKPTLIFKTCNL
jgi:hypothetical protein